jgi:hypothetical protein
MLKMEPEPPKLYLFKLSLYLIDQITRLCSLIFLSVNIAFCFCLLFIFFFN